MKQILATVLCALTITPSAFAKTPSEHLATGWNHYYYLPFLNRLANVPNLQGQTSESQQKCEQFYSHVKSTGQMKIVMGLGYYDFSEGEPFVLNYTENGQNLQYNFGMNATIDIAYDFMYREILTKACSGNLQLCGFTEDSSQRGLYRKRVRSPDGKKVDVTLEIRQPSVTPEHQSNIGALHDQQVAKSEAVTQWFFGSFQTADLVVYNGHSRKGGGPDFSPPRLLSNSHVDYDWYQANTPGLRRLLNALSGAHKPEALMMMSCNSANLFQTAIHNAAPNMAFSGTNAVIPGDIPNKTAMAGMDSFLRFQCQEGIIREMQLDPDQQQQIRPLIIN